MEVSNRVNPAPFIKVQQTVRHDVWGLRKKDDGSSYLVKIDNNVSGTSANNQVAAANVENITTPRTNSVELGARPKVTLQVPRKQNILNINATNIPKSEVQVPKKNVITFTPVSASRNEVLTIKTTAPPKCSENTMQAAAAPLKEDSALKTSVPPAKGVAVISTVPKKEVITINTAAAPKKELVITINTKPVPKEVFAVNTASAPKQQAASLSTEATSSGAAASACFTKLEELMKHNIFNFKKEEEQVEQQGASSSKNESGRCTLRESPTLYSDEACRIQEMFPGVPLKVIANDLISTGSMEATIEKLLEGKVFIPPESPSHSASSTVSPNVKEAVAPQSSKTEKSVPETKKKGGSVIKIELQTKMEVWDIKKKDKEACIMRKVKAESAALSQSNKPSGDASCVDNSVEAMEEECEDPLSVDDILIGDTPYKAAPDQEIGPVKLLVFSQSSNKLSPVSKRRAVAVPAGAKIQSSMEVDNFDGDHLSQDESVSLESFDFSDDENEEGVTIEQFLFKASLVLKKLKYLNESKIQESNSELLNITGCSKSEKSDTDMAEESTKSEKGSDADMDEEKTKNEKESDTSMAEEVCSGDDDDDYYTDECYTDEESQ